MQEQQMLTPNIAGILSQIQLKDIMSKKILTVSGAWPVKRLSKFLLDENISGAPVVNADDELVGVVTHTDIVRFESTEPTEEQVKKLIAEFSGQVNGEVDQAEVNRIQHSAHDYCKVDTIMTPHVVSIDIDNSLEDAHNLALDKQVHRIFVTEDGLLVGVLTAMDILKALTTK